MHEILRQGKQDLGLAGHTATHDFQILCAGNLTGRGKLLARVDVAYVVGLEARVLSPQARRVLESGEVAVCECSIHPIDNAAVVRQVAHTPSLPLTRPMT